MNRLPTLIYLAVSTATCMLVGFLLNKPSGVALMVISAMALGATLCAMAFAWAEAEEEEH